jgi:aryl-alcohol dehydrogenase-like predicted oxidoreductase
MPWSPLVFGLLTGKYDCAKVEANCSRNGGLPRDVAIDNARGAVDDMRLDDAPFGDTLFT